MGRASKERQNFFERKELTQRETEIFERVLANGEFAQLLVEDELWASRFFRLDIAE